MEVFKYNFIQEENGT